MDNLYIQAIGMVAFAFGAVGFSVNKRTMAVIFLAIGAAIWTLHYILLGGYVTACLTFAIGVRTLLSARVETVRQRHILFFVSSGVFVVLAALAWQGPVSIFPLLAAINASYAFSYRGNLGMRLQLLLSSALWIANGFAWGSVAHVLSESCIVILNLRVISRLYAAKSATVVGKTNVGSTF